MKVKTQRPVSLTLDDWSTRAFVELVGSLREQLDDAQVRCDAERQISETRAANLAGAEERLRVQAHFTSARGEDAAKAQASESRLRSVMLDTSDQLEVILARVRGAIRISATRRDVDDLVELAKKLRDGAKS